MKTYDIKNINYRDQAARRHRRVFVLKIVIWVLGVVAVVAGIIYILFFSKIFDIREVGFNGLDTVGSDVFRVKIDENLNQKILAYLPRRNNIFFVDTDDFENEFVSAYPVFKSVNIQRELFHGLIFNFLERKPSGIWCFSSTLLTASCSYFDVDKVLWGQPAKSSGFIFLTIEDHRTTSNRQIDDEFFKPIMEVAKYMAGKVKSVVIPENSFNEFLVYTADYYIIFTTDFDVQNQLGTLKIFMDEKTQDSPPAGGFHPQYIDLRIDGRVYYK